MRTKRRYSPQVDALEGKVLLSTGLAHPAASDPHPKHVVLNGTVRGLPSGSTGPEGYTVSSFDVAGNVAGLGHVNGVVELADPVVPIGGWPDLSNATLVLYNQKGSVAVTISPSIYTHYRFKVLGGTGADARAYGSGMLHIFSRANSFEFAIKLNS